MQSRSPYSYSQWKPLIPGIDQIIAEMEQANILSVGITPYTRITPSFFLKNYAIYAIKRSSDVDVMESVAHMNVLEDFHPDIATRVHGTGYLIGNFAFQSFLRSRRAPPTLLINTIADKSIQDLDRLKVRWLGNAPKTFESVMYKGAFRDLIESLGLPALPTTRYVREDFLKSDFKTLWARLEGPFVVQRADKEVGGNEGTFFIHDETEFGRCLSALGTDETFRALVVSPFIEGDSTSMLGCVMEQGTLSGPLQLQLIDVPESLHGIKPSGIFFGNDIGFDPWDESIKADAQKVVEGVGAHLRSCGYKGVFGIDFLYDKKRNKIYPNECNPRFTGSLLLYSLMLLEAGVPPLEFFHIMAHLGIKSEFDFNAVNKALKTRISCAHIAFSPKGIPNMGLPLLAGVYSYDAAANELSYKGPGISLADLKDENEFLLIDTVPRMGEAIEQSVPRLFKFIFRRSIAESSYRIDPRAGFLVDRFARALLAAVSSSTK
ncbi:MAG: ATP-grasp domain-containing protein [Patescibacteria group bacterium]|nr:ATP-grasp domain-containing protein [Patescibacteria group bacterium]MDE2116659.1 ATP-grasp domain-containing protein [Patescibacteria group bacterium]